MIALEKRPTLSAVLRPEPAWPENRHGRRYSRDGQAPLCWASSTARRFPMARCTHRKVSCEANGFTIRSQGHALGSNPRNEPLMTDQIVITEKTSQAKDIRAAVGSRY